MQYSDFQFHMPIHILFGDGLAQRMNEYLPGKQVLIICDPFLFKNGIAQQIGETLHGKAVSYFSEIEPNPSCESVDIVARMAREIQADCIVGLGGGSALDVSKIVACLTTSPGSVYDYYSGESELLAPRQTKLVCIPTTAGTGSEVTNVGVFTNSKTHVKMPLVTAQFWPDYAIVDPALTLTLPPVVTASTGMDAFCHAIEAYWNKSAQPICDLLSVRAMQLILQNAQIAYEQPDNQEARAAMLLASLLAGIAFSQTRTTGIHAVSFPLTAEFGASHGDACSITLPAFIRISVQQKKEKMQALAQQLGYTNVSALADAVEALMRRMQMPTRLHELGVQEHDLLHIAQVGMRAAIIQLTPATMTEQTVHALLRSIL